MGKDNPVLLGKAEIHLDLELLRRGLEAKLRGIQNELPESYTSITLICRTDKEAQQIVLSNKMDIEADIEALKTMKV